MIGDPEPGPDPRKIRDPNSRHPAEPIRVPLAIRSYREDKQYVIRCTTHEEALDVKSEITSAVYHLNTWHNDPETGRKWDIRVRPWLSQHWDDEDGEHTVFKGTSPPEGADTYWKVNFHVHDPRPQGFRTMSPEDVEAAHRKSAQTRGVSISRPGRRRRTVEQRGE